MLSFKHVIFPVDFSRRSEGAAHIVRMVASCFDSTVHLIYVMAPPIYEAMSIEISGPVMADMMTKYEDAAREKLNGYLTEDLRGLKAQRVMLTGDPATEIVRYAHKNAADLIVMPSHGYGAFRRFVLGSTTAKVLHDAECPVLTGAHLESMPEAKDIHIRTVLAAVDLEEQTDTVLRCAGSLAAKAGAKLAVVHVASSQDEEIGEDLRRRMKEMAIEAEVVIGHGDPDKTVAEVARERNADVLVIGRGVSEGLMGRLRAQAHSIIRQSPCPVLSV